MTKSYRLLNSYHSPNSLICGNSTLIVFPARYLSPEIVSCVVCTYRALVCLAIALFVPFSMVLLRISRPFINLDRCAPDLMLSAPAPATAPEMLPITALIAAFSQSIFPSLNNKSFPTLDANIPLTAPTAPSKVASKRSTSLNNFRNVLYF